VVNTIEGHAFCYADYTLSSQIYGGIKKKKNYGGMSSSRTIKCEESLFLNTWIADLFIYLFWQY
jgi:hypothetical protein